MIKPFILEYVALNCTKRPIKCAMNIRIRAGARGVKILLRFAPLFIMTWIEGREGDTLVYLVARLTAI